MIEAGVLRPEDRVELIEGEILPMVPMGSAHAACIRKLNNCLSAQIQGEAILSIQCPLRLGERSEPEPDVLLLAPREDFYESAHPTASDVLLLIEVGDTSIAFDREIKIPLYARHGVPEVWLIDLSARRIEVYRSPGKSGYRRRRIIEAQGELRALRIPRLRIDANSILPGK